MDTAFAQGPPNDNPMRDHMRQMMRGVVPPPGLVPEALPDPAAEGAQVLVRYCTQCHDLPSPRYKTAEQWPAVLERMLARMEMMSGGGMMGMRPVQVPPLPALNTLLAYLQANGMRQARPEELAAGPQSERAGFVVTCTQCHALPSPRLHPAAAWPAIVARMQVNMGLMARPAMNAKQLSAITHFLQEAARAASP